MTRQIFVILLASFYLVISTGFTVNAHFCAGKMVDVEVFSKPEHCCSKNQSCHQEDPKCCDDESILVQLDQWQLPSTLPVYQVDVIMDGTVPVKILENSCHDQQEVIFSINLPPPKPNDLWLLYHRLTYYG